MAKKKLKRAGDGPDRVYKALRDIIVEQTLALGARLPEDAVATRFGVSRTVVRAAIARLVADGLVERPRNQVARVASPTREEADDLMAVRAELEASIVARLAKDVTTKQIEKLRAHVREEEGALKDRGRAVRLSGEFHVLLAAATGSKLFERYMVDIIARSSLVFTAQTTTNALCCSPREHAEIIDAIEKRDVAKAQARMRKHLDDCADRSRQRFGPAENFADLPASAIRPLTSPSPAADLRPKDAARVGDKPDQLDGVHPRGTARRRRVPTL